MKFKVLALVASSLIAAPSLAAESTTGLVPQFSSLPAAEASRASRVQTGTINGLTYTAKSAIIGQTPTSDVLPPSNTIGGGNPIYKPSSNKSGVVALIMQTSQGAFICSGSVIGGGMSIATAAHCVSDGFGTTTGTPTRTTAYFFDGDPDTRTVRASNPVQIDVSRYIINPGYTGEVIDQNDIAILRLEHAAPKFAQVYDLYNADIKGLNFNVAGYGTRSTVGGAQGNTAGARTGYLREGDNKFDYAWGDALFQGFFTTRDVGGQFDGQNFFGFAEVEYSYISDFDNGLSAQSTARRIANAIGLGPIGNANFNDNGVGAREVGIAGGDSGGPGFIDGKLASINSYGLTFGQNFGDIDAAFNAGFGEFSGYVPTFIHQDFINAAVAVPEPGTWSMLIVGFGFAGAAMRRQRKAVATA